MSGNHCMSVSSHTPSSSAPTTVDRETDIDVIVTLTFIPINFNDAIARRILTLTSDKDVIAIGRASKVEAKQLLPACDNAWFDSRVMSRKHAKIFMFPDRKVRGGSNHLRLSIG
jgi:hypothetical protein